MRNLLPTNYTKETKKEKYFVLIFVFFVYFAGKLLAVKSEILMSLAYLKEAIEKGESEKLIRYVRLHFGDGNEEKGAAEIDKAWIEALKPMLELPETDREFIFQTLAEKDAATLAHLFFHLHFYFVEKSGEWIHDGKL